MAVTIANVATPNATTTEGSLLGLKAKLIDVTFDSSYVTAGEPLTAISLGWDQLHGAIPVTQATTTTGTTAYAVQARPNTTKTQLQLFLYSTTAATAPMAEVANAVNASTFTVRLLVLGS